MFKFGAMLTNIRVLLFTLVLCGFAVTLRAQTVYDQTWKRIDVLADSLDRPKEALNLVQGLYARARREHNPSQAIRALLYTVRLDQPLLGNADSANIRLLETSIDTFPEPAKAIMESLTAQAYWNKYRAQSYKVRLRTPGGTAPGPDVNTWTEADYVHRIDSLFSASLHDTSLLGRTDVSQYDPVVEKGNSLALRPTLLDLLVHRAIRFYSSGDASVTSYEESFCPDRDLFAPAGEFMTHVFKVTVSDSLPWKAISLYQSILRFHAHEPKPDAFVDADVHRLDLARKASSQDSADVWYEVALRRLVHRYTHGIAGASATYALAAFLEQKGSDYQVGSVDSSNRWTLKEALSLCDTLVRNFPSSPGGKNARDLASEIRNPDLHTITAMTSLPGQPILASVQYKNCPLLHLRLLKQDRLPLRLSYDRMVQILDSVRPYRSWTQSLPNPGDYHIHRTEIGVEPLPVGTYVLLASTSDRFGKDGHPVEVTYFDVTDIGWIKTGTGCLYVVHRGSGEPIAGARVSVTNAKTKTTRVYVTDTNGQCPWDYQGSSSVRINTGNDSTWLDEQGLFRLYSENDRTASRPEPRFTGFTDRPIYRPGQTIFFKAIGIIQDTTRHMDVPYRPGKPLTFYLESQGRNLDSLVLTPDEFGSVYGHLVLSSSVLTGSHCLIKEGERNDIAYISVEEYKRPKYSVSFQKPAGDYGLGDTLDLKGSATAYAGNAVAGALVSYTVTRSTDYPIRWDRPNFIPIRHSIQKTIITERTRTSADGSFSVRFPLQPEPGMKRGLDPMFTYTVNADVTDINGETHSARFSMTAAYASLSLSLVLPPAGREIADSLRTLDIQCYNRSGLPQHTVTTVTISRLEPPQRPTRKRLWPAPDQFTLTEDVFHKLFPHDPYGEGSDPSCWPIREKLLRDTFTTGYRPAYALNSLHLRTGEYRVEVTAADIHGHPVSTGGYLEVYDPAEARLPFPAYAWNMPGNLDRKDSVIYFAGSTGGKRFAIEQVLRAGRTEVKTLRLQDTVSRLAFATVHGGRGGFSFGLAYWADNRVYTSVIPIGPLSRKLSIHYSTFRDKLDPGSTERLSLTIRGAGGEAVEAEVLASMYDASLDQFDTHTWRLPSIDEVSGGPNWQTAVDAPVDADRLYYPRVREVLRFVQRYDDFRDVSFTRRGRYVFSFDSQKELAKEEISYVMPQRRMMAAPAALNAEATTTPPPVTFRKDFNETAFFYPDLRTDDSGHLSFTFTIPEALTQWTLQTLAHTRDLDFGLDKQTFITQKTLMVQPNIPRFLREGDDAWLSTKVVSQAGKDVEGTARLEVLDAINMQPVPGMGDQQSFSLKAGSSTALRFHLAIPPGFTDPLVYRLSAVAGNYSDGEQGPIPVLSRRVLLTETYPLTSDSRIQVTPLLQNIAPYRLTLEYAANPVWYVLKALPYMEGTKDACPQEIADRYYSNALGAYLLQTIPGIRSQLPALAKDSSPLNQDADLKNALLEETPWVLDAGHETASMQRLASFLDTARLAGDQTKALQTLTAQQYPSGAFPWFDGGPASRYSTQYIVTRFGKLASLGVPLPASWAPVLKNAFAYLDTCLKVDYRTSDGFRDEDLQYLYARSFFPDSPPDKTTKAALDTMLRRAKAHWVNASLYDQALIALISTKTGDTATAGNILTSLEQRTILSPDRGRYWKDNDGGWSWTQAPIETQALLITAFSEAGKDPVIIDQLRNWLFSQKQTNAWSTGPATADACYTLLRTVRQDLSPSPVVNAHLGVVHIESGSTPFKQQWEGSALHPSMGNIDVRVKNSRHGWGAVYYQYFQDIDSVQSAQTSISVQKQVFAVHGLASTMRPLHEGDTIRLGDRVRIRLILRSDRPLEFVHLKDLRAGCLEPVDVTSGYRFLGGVGCYVSPRDLSTSFFIDWLPKGTSVLEYDQFVNMEGTFSGGMATLQSFYAPQFSARSAGVRLKALP